MKVGDAPPIYVCKKVPASCILANSPKLSKKSTAHMFRRLSRTHCQSPLKVRCLGLLVVAFMAVGHIAELRAEEAPCLEHGWRQPRTGSRWGDAPWPPQAILPTVASQTPRYPSFLCPLSNTEKAHQPLLHASAPRLTPWERSSKAHPGIMAAPEREGKGSCAGGRCVVVDLQAWGTRRRRNVHAVLVTHNETRCGWNPISHS